MGKRISKMLLFVGYGGTPIRAQEATNHTSPSGIGWTNVATLCGDCFWRVVRDDVLDAAKRSGALGGA
ncbi:hypothetical protein E2562_005573 [Oryza meyeriana var. granulata]|uniref:Uncharacterized protein n=1 Tax=Oryza meyeriana var. granulata TaxID=110450 RepID=A0A6G1F439_9ORYZ|nr:hypothetical protein E2562_005573 [Oryza meyeriana var. granulata]